jgi:hypothetical protein
LGIGIIAIVFVSARMTLASPWPQEKTPTAVERLREQGFYLAASGGFLSGVTFPNYRDEDKYSSGSWTIGLGYMYRLGNIYLSAELEYFQRKFPNGTEYYDYNTPEGSFHETYTQSDRSLTNISIALGIGLFVSKNLPLVMYANLGLGSVQQHYYSEMYDHLEEVDPFYSTAANWKGYKGNGRWENDNFGVSFGAGLKYFLFRNLGIAVEFTNCSVTETGMSSLGGGLYEEAESTSTVFNRIAAKICFII